METEAEQGVNDGPDSGAFPLQVPHRLALNGSQSSVFRNNENLQGLTPLFDLEVKSVLMP